MTKVVIGHLIYWELPLLIVFIVPKINEIE